MRQLSWHNVAAAFFFMCDCETAKHFMFVIVHLCMHPLLIILYAASLTQTCHGIHFSLCPCRFDLLHRRHETPRLGGPSLGCVSVDLVSSSAWWPWIRECPSRTAGGAQAGGANGAMRLCDMACLSMEDETRRQEICLVSGGWKSPSLAKAKVVPSS